MRMAVPDRLHRAQAVIETLFEGRVDAPFAVGVTDPRQPQPMPLADEAAHLSRALPRRQREFASGRAAVRQAMEALGQTPCSIPAAQDRAPIWPAGLCGSISHKTTLCAAVVSLGAQQSLGLDIEENSDLARDLIDTICDPDERAQIAGPDEARRAKLIFCAKEAVYKAQYPLTGLVFGFDHINVRLDMARGFFAATFLKPAGSFAVNHRVAGRFAETEGHLVTGVVMQPLDQKGA